jgi:hypothetical protein
MAGGEGGKEKETKKEKKKEGKKEARTADELACARAEPVEVLSVADVSHPQPACKYLPASTYLPTRCACNDFSRYLLR